MTNGELGRAGENPEETAVIRQGEAIRASWVLGTSEPKFLNLPDSKLSENMHYAPKIATLIEEYQPNVIYAPHENEEHPDHKATFEIMAKAFALTNLKSEIYLYEIWTPLQHYDLVEDISKWIGVKILAIREHYSQITRMRFDEAILGLARYRGEFHNRPNGPYAEVFARYV